MSEDKAPPTGKTTLSDDEIVSGPATPKRRSLLVAFGAGAAALLAAGFSSLVPGRASASTLHEAEAERVPGEQLPPGVAQSGCTDSDSGRYADQGGNGRRCRGPRRRYRRNCSDSDSGRFGDRAGRGRNC